MYYLSEVIKHLELLTSLIIFTASLVRPSFLAHMASRRFINTSTLVSRPSGKQNQKHILTLHLTLQ